ncbi:MAG: flavodoxin family protein [Alphaproteobacteria bacterium]|nr:flavodoxin family protein [Alphaproteobacteria bacterium]
MALKRIVVVQAHPDRAGHRLCHALGETYAAAAREAGHEVAVIDLAALDVPLLSSQAEFEHQPIPESLRPASESILAADHMVFVFPLWLGTLPALLKAFLEQLLRPGIAFRYRERGMPERLLKGRSARLIVTMGMPVPVYRLYFGGHGLKVISRSMLGFCGVAPVRETLFGMVETAGAKTREKWFRKMRALGARGA